MYTEKAFFTYIHVHVHVLYIVVFTVVFSMNMILQCIYERIHTYASYSSVVLTISLNVSNSYIESRLCLCVCTAQAVSTVCGSCAHTRAGITNSF